MKIIKSSYGILTGLIAFAVYLLTISHSITEFDSGELAAVQATLGIAHPPGYPLFTILGYIFSKIPLGITKIYQLNILCSLWCVGAVIFFTHTSKLLLDNLGKLKTTKETNFSSKIFNLLNNNDPDAELLKYIAAVISGLFFAFSLIVWSQSTSVEVYSLQFFLFSVIIFLFFRMYFYADSEDGLLGGTNKGWILVGIFLGLGFSNHLMTFYLLPALLFLYFSKYKFTGKSIARLIIIAAITFIVTAGLYSYLIVRSAQHPQLNWGNPDNLSRAIDHISAKYYEGMFFAGIDNVLRQLKFLFNSFGFYDGKFLAGDFNINLIFCITGIVISFISLRRYFYFNLILFLTTVLFTVNYDIPDIYEYFSLSIFSLYLVGIPAIILIVNAFKSPKYGALFPLLILSIILFIRIGANYRVADESHKYLFEDYVNSILKTVDRNAIIFANNWDYIISPSYYIQYVEGYRNDVQILSTQLLPLDWYKPNFVRKGNIIIDSLLRYEDASPLINKSENSIYLAPDIYRDEFKRNVFRIPPNKKIIPDVLLFRIIGDDKYYPAPDPDFLIRMPKTKSVLSKYVEDLICFMLVNRIKYELNFDKYERARIYYLKLVENFPDFIIPPEVEKYF